MDAHERPAHYDDLSEVDRAAWDMMVRGANDRRHAFHQVTLATVTPDCLPRARTVVLRAADRAGRTLRFHTDTRSHKYAELEAQPACALHFYDHGAKIQVRARGRARLHNRDDVTAGIWTGMRDMSKACYRQPVGPGARLGEPGEAHAGGPLPDAGGYDNFVAVSVAIHEIEWLYLAAAGHRRALLCYAYPPSAQWVAP